METATRIRDLAKSAREASHILAVASPEAKNQFFRLLSELLERRQPEILAANEKDLALASAAGMDAPRQDRLRLTSDILSEMRSACEHVASLPDPIGSTETQWQRPNGLLVGKMRIPLGVIAIIYEARPNVTIDSAILCIKAGNAVILRGGSEAEHSNFALIAILREALAMAGLPEDAAQFVHTGGHGAVLDLCRLGEYIDVIIPRGGEKLVAAVTESATMPVLKHYKGVCHAYIDDEVDYGQACRIVVNAKTQRPGVCNALEGLLVHKNVAGKFLPLLAQAMAPWNVEFRACEASMPLLGPRAVRQSPSDLGHEFHDRILAVCIVDDMQEAINCIRKYGSRHTEIICTKNYNNAMRFLRQVDASMVGVNVSTRFNDGGQLGLGAEIGISTSKLHAYGPMGVMELTTTKFVVLGDGQIRQ